MTRLLQSTKDRIFQRAMEHRKDDVRGTALQIESFKLARQVWDRIYTDVEHSALLTLAPYLKQIEWRTMNFIYRGYRYDLQVQWFSAEQEKAFKQFQFPVPPTWIENGVTLNKLDSTKGGRELIEAIKNHHLVIKDFNREKGSAKDAVLQLLNAVKTDKQLRKVWPEGEDIYGDLITVETINLPAISSDKVNKLLGLKKAA